MTKVKLYACLTCGAYVPCMHNSTDGAYHSEVHPPPLLVQQHASQDVVGGLGASQLTVHLELALHDKRGADVKDLSSITAW
jgi:hypothetical protein